MAHFITDEQLFEGCIRELEERAKPSKNDIRYQKYVKYINSCTEKFGDEKVYLVGSTGERSKLAFSKDDGDADFLLVSGKIKIQEANLEPNTKAPCYVWIRADESSRDIGLKIIEDKYISANTLREVRPELFTVLRAVFLQITATVDRLPETNKDRTILSVSSKVGLQTTVYRSLQIDEDISKFRRNSFYSLNARERKKKIEQRWKGIKVHDVEKQIYKRVYEILKIVIPPDGRREDNGGISFFAQFAKDVVERQNDTNHERLSENKNKEHELYARTFQVDSDNKKIDINDNICVRVTHGGKDHKDYVPVLVIKGSLQCMEQWKRRVEARGWLPSEVDTIFNADVCLVARVSPINPNVEKDFCLAFNLAEQMLMKRMTIAQKRVFLILKAFLKGVFAKHHRERKKELRLKTFHLKIMMFWFNEHNSNDNNESTQTLLQNALTYFDERLTEKNLPHYFVPNYNLFAEFMPSDYEILKKCMDEVRKNPIESLNYYIGLNDGRRGEVLLTRDEIDCLLDMSADGGRREHIDKLEESMVDFQRGLNDKRNADGYCPLEEAILDIVRICISEDGRVDNSQFKQLHDFITKGEVDLTMFSMFRGSKKEKGVVANVMNRTGFVCCWLIVRLLWLLLLMGFTMHQLISLILYFCEFNAKIKHKVNKFGGMKEVRHIVRGAFCGKPLDFDIDLTEQIVDTVHRYLNCPDEQKDDLSSELKYKIAGFFLCRKEFPDVSGLRHV